MFMIVGKFMYVLRCLGLFLSKCWLHDPCGKTSGSPSKRRGEGFLRNNCGFTGQNLFCLLWFTVSSKLWVNLQLTPAHPLWWVWATNYFNRPSVTVKGLFCGKLWLPVMSCGLLVPSLLQWEILRDSLQYLPIITLWLCGCEGEKTQAH